MSKINLLGGLPGFEREGGGYKTGYSVYGTDGICPALLANGGGYGILIVEEVDVPMPFSSHRIVHATTRSARIKPEENRC